MKNTQINPNQVREDAQIASAAKRMELHICADSPAGIRAVLLRALALIDEVEADPENTIAGWVGALHSAPKTWASVSYEHTPASPYFPSDPRRH